MRRGVSLPGTVSCKSYSHCIAARLYCRTAPIYRRAIVSPPRCIVAIAAPLYRHPAVSLPRRIAAVPYISPRCTTTAPL